MKIGTRVNLEMASLWMRGDGILVVHIYDQRDLELADAIEIVQAEGELTGGKKVPILHIIDKASLPSQEIREYSASEEGTLYGTAEAYITQSLAQRILGNFYVRFNKPRIPARMFTSERDAIDWLGQFK